VQRRFEEAAIGPSLTKVAGDDDMTLLTPTTGRESSPQVIHALLHPQLLSIFRLKPLKTCSSATVDALCPLVTRTTSGNQKLSSDSAKPNIEQGCRLMIPYASVDALLGLPAAPSFYSAVMKASHLYLHSSPRAPEQRGIYAHSGWGRAAGFCLCSWASSPRLEIHNFQSPHFILTHDHSSAQTQYSSRPTHAP
jgi:hypothetical protein